MDIGFVVHVHVFNVHRESIAFRDHLKAGHDISQFSLCWHTANSAASILLSGNVSTQLENHSSIKFSFTPLGGEILYRFLVFNIGDFYYMFAIDEIFPHQTTLYS